MTRALLAAAVATAMCVSPAGAVPTFAPYVEAPTCDAHAITLTHELGNGPLPPFPGPFPPGEAIVSSVAPDTLTGCQPIPGIGTFLPDWDVAITNMSGTSWVDLFFVADGGLLYNNVDGGILGGAAFKIDTVGINAPLISEDIAANLIFEPGETWHFFVLDWDPILNGGPPALFTSIGVGAGSLGPPSNASIVARPVSLPGGLLLLAVGVASLIVTTRRGE